MAWVILVVLGTIWGSSYLFIKVGGAELPPFTLVAMRTTLAGLVLAVILFMRKEPIPPRHIGLWRWLFVMGLLNSVVPYTLITWGEIHISSGLAAILVGTMPIFTVLFAYWFTHDEKFTLLQLAGILVGFTGVVVLFLPDLVEGIQWSAAGSAAVIAAAISYSLAAIFARKHLKNSSEIVVSFGQMLFASIVLVPLSVVVDRPWELDPTLSAIGAVVALALLGTAFAYLMYYYLIRVLGATRTSLVTYISPVVAVVLGAVFLGEILAWNILLGLACIIAGVGLVTRKRSPQAVPLVSAEEV